MPEVTSYAAGTPCWVDLTTSDPDGARAFYASLFGWELEIGPAETGYYAQARVRGLPVAGISGQPKPDELPVAWMIYLAADDLDDAVKRVLENGGTVSMAPLEVMGQGRMAIAIDPTGAAFGLWQAGQHFGAALINEPGALCWSELGTRDLGGARRFYSAVFGYEWEDVDTGEGAPEYTTLTLDGRAVAGAYTMSDDMPAEIPPNWMADFAVTDADATVAKAQELGGGVSMPPVDSPYGRYAILRDPQGGVFSVIRLAS
jgi:uncharacterized protein